MANAILAAVLSFILPGIGQMYAGDAKRGLIFFLVYLILAVAAFFTGFLLSIITLIIRVYTAYDAYKMLA